MDNKNPNKKPVIDLILEMIEKTLDPKKLRRTPHKKFEVNKNFSSGSSACRRKINQRGKRKSNQCLEKNER